MHTPAIAAFVASTWAERAHAEIGAGKRFRRLAARLRRAGAPAAIAAMALRSSRDETRHARLCRDLARELGHDTGFRPLPIPADKRAALAPAARGDREQLLCDVVAICCLTETINAALLAVLHEKTDLSPVKATLETILDDELNHGRLGWAWLAHEAERQDLRPLGPRLPALLEAAVRDELFEAPCGGSDGESLRHGVLPPAMRLQQFANTLETVVFPGFALFDVDTGPARTWLYGRAAPLLLAPRAS
jgi:hypothetical protein